MSTLLKYFRRHQQEQLAAPKTPEPVSARNSLPGRIEHPAAPAALLQPVLLQTDEYLDIFRDANQLLVEVKKQYNETIKVFDNVFELYASKNPDIVKLNASSIAEGAHHALSCADTSQSARVFGETVQRILQTTKAIEMQPSFGKQVCSVLSPPRPPFSYQ